MLTRRRVLAGVLVGLVWPWCAWSQPVPPSNLRLGGGSMPLVDTGLIVRYYIDEAASGQGPTAVLDGSSVGAAFDLTITYAAALNYVEISGNRGLESTAIDGVQRADKAIDDTSDKVRDNLAGAQTITVEAVARVDDFSASTGRLLAINAATDNATLGFVGTSSTVMQFYMNGTLMRTWDPGTARAVWHAVVDTTQATANDRIKLYKDGVLQSPTVDANPALNATLSIAAASRLFMLNRGSTGFERSMDGVIFYAALYSAAFTAANVTTNADILTADDDTPAGAAAAELPGHGLLLAGIRNRLIQHV